MSLVTIIIAAYVVYLIWDMFYYSRISMSQSYSRFSFAVTVKLPPKGNKEKARWLLERRWSEFKAGKLNEITLREMVEKDIEECNGHITRWDLKYTP